MNRTLLRGPRLVGVLAASVVVLALPAAALAAPEEPTPEVEPVAEPSSAEASGTPDEPVFAGCPTVTTLSPGTVSEAGAPVTVTAQAFEQGVEGWSLVAWEAAAGHRVTAVAITRDGSTTVLGDPATTHAEDVDVLTFCTEPDPDHAPEGGGEAAAGGPEDEGSVEVGPSQTLDAPAAPATPEGPATAAGAPGPPPGPTGPAATASDPAGPVPAEPPTAATGPEASSPSDEVVAAEQTEVLGVTLARTPPAETAAPTIDAVRSPGNRTPVPGLLAGALLLGGLLAASNRLLHRGRRSDSRAATA